MRLRSSTTASCIAPDWDAQHVGCYAAADVDAPALRTWAAEDGGMALGRCTLACLRSGDAERMEDVVIGVRAGGCHCLSAAPSAKVKRRADSECAAPCGADESQLCGGAETLSVYRAPAGLSATVSAGGDQPCAFAPSADATPALHAVSPGSAAPGTVLTLSGSGFAPSGAGAVAVTVCGQPCEVAASSEAQVTCAMPACSAATSAVMLHVPPRGYASHPAAGDVTVGGVLALQHVLRSDASGAVVAGAAEGSAAGGARLVLRGTGFGAASSMRVVLDGGGELVPCEVTSSSREGPT